MASDSGRARASAVTLFRIAASEPGAAPATDFQTASLLAYHRAGVTKPSAFLVAAIALVVTALGCKGEREQAERAEAGRIAHAIAALRDAPNEAKPPRIAALDSEKCTSEALCELKRVCVDAYRTHVRGLEAARIAARALDSDGESQARERIAELVAASERDLVRARELVRRCSDLESEVVRRFGL